MHVCSIIVCYNPDIKNLQVLCQNLRHSESSIILVDNSEEFNTALDSFASSVIRLETNRGIAFAQNAGIDLAINSGADVLVFFDQDSKIDEPFLSSLLAPIIIGQPMVVGPVFYDMARKFEYPSFKFNRLGLLNKVYSGGRTNPYPVDVIISSGSAATKETFTKAGKMDEDFFIDFVDIEWSIRCRKNNIPIIVVPGAKMKHSIGEKSIDLALITGFIHSPARSYYKVRNPFILLRKGCVPLILALKEIVAALTHQAIFIFFVQNRKEYLQMYFKGILHGMTGVLGKSPL